MPLTIHLSPAWRVRRAWLEAWLVEQGGALAAGRAFVWLPDELVARSLARWAAWELGAPVAAALGPAADLGRRILLRSGRLASAPRAEEQLAGVAATLAAAPGARYGAFAARPRTCTALAGTLGLLRAEEPEPGRWVQCWGAAVPHRRADLEALAQLEGGLRGLLAARHKTLRAELDQQAAGLVSPELLGLETLLVVEPVHLSAAERELLTALARRGGLARLEVLLPGELDPRAPAFAMLAPVRRMLDDLGAVCHSLGDAPSARVTRLEVPSPQRGLTEVFRQMSAHLDESPAARPGEQVLVVPDLRAWAPALQTQAQRYRVPLSVVGEATRTLTEWADLSVRVLTLVARGFPRRGWLDLLSLPAVAVAEPAAVAALERASRDANLVDGTPAEWLDELARLGRVVPRGERCNDATLAAARELLELLAPAFAELAPAHPATWRERLVGWLVALTKADADTGQAQLAELAPLLMLDAWPADGRLSASDYAALAEQLLVAGSASPAAEPGRVLATTPDCLAGGVAQRLYVLWPLAGLLPRSPRGALPLDAADLASMELSPLTPATSLEASGAALHWRNLLTAADEVVLVCPLVDADGRPARLSPLLDDLPAELPTTRLAARDRLPGPATARNPAEWVAATVRAALAGELEPGPGAARVTRAVEAGLTELSRRAGDGLAAGFSGCLSGPAAGAVAARYGDEHVFSPSRLQRYAAWPFGFFVAEVLRVDDRAEPTGGLDALTEGYLMHALLRGCLEGGRAPAEVAARLLSDDRRRPGFSAALWRKVRARLTGWTERLLAEAPRGAHWPGDAVPALFEQEFGRFGWLPLELADDETRALVGGRLDRADRGADGWVVLDYKRRARGSAGSVGDEELALTLYALALERRCGEPVVGWALLDYRDPARSAGCGMVPNVSGAAERVLPLVRGIRAAQFGVQPAPPPTKLYPSSRWRWTALARLADVALDESEGGEA